MSALSPLEAHDIDGAYWCVTCDQRPRYVRGECVACYNYRRRTGGPRPGELHGRTWQKHDWSTLQITRT